MPEFFAHGTRGRATVTYTRGCDHADRVLWNRRRTTAKEHPRVAQRRIALPLRRDGCPADMVPSWPRGLPRPCRRGYFAVEPGARNRRPKLESGLLKRIGVECRKSRGQTLPGPLIYIAAHLPRVT